MPGFRKCLKNLTARAYGSAHHRQWEARGSGTPGIGTRRCAGPGDASLPRSCSWGGFRDPGGEASKVKGRWAIPGGPPFAWRSGARTRDFRLGGYRTSRRVRSLQRAGRAALGRLGYLSRQDPFVIYAQAAGPATAFEEGPGPASDLPSGCELGARAVRGSYAKHTIRRLRDSLSYLLTELVLGARQNAQNDHTSSVGLPGPLS
jgi:hypothetical protein